MKKLFFIAALLLGFVYGGFAQDKSIVFEETRVWKEIVEKAKNEKKLIFVDCYTDWCGPCKMLSGTVFTQDAVADFFNENFVNAKFEMEKDADGILLKDKFQVRAFPTMVFVDPVTENVVHKLVGAGKAEWLIEGGREAMNPKDNLSGMMDRYKAGERSPEFIVKYLGVLKSAYMSDEQAKVTGDYLDVLSVDQLATEDNWLLIRENVSDPISKPLRQVMANRQKFYDIAGEKVVDTHLSNAILGAANTMARWEPGRAGEFNTARNAELTQYLRSIDYPAAAPALAFLETAELVRKGDWNGVVHKMKEVEKSNVLQGNASTAYFQLNIESLARSNDKNIIEEGVKMIDEKIAQAGDNFYRKADLSQAKVRLYTSVGDKMAADKAKMEEEEYAKEGAAATGGRTQRAMRMN